MNVNIRKGERKIVLLKRERQTLTDAKALLAELANIGGEVADDAEAAADKINDVLLVLDGKVAVAPPY
jgi:hypothetical protein